jgi:hypothetical protein
MKKLGVSLLVCVFLSAMWVLPVMAADTSQEIEQLKDEVQRLLKRIEDLEKKQTETQTKTVETEKKAEEVAKKTEKVEKKTLKDRLEFSGELRARALIENAKSDQGFYGVGQPNRDLHFRDETSFPLRIRLKAHAEVVPDWVDFYARLTMNKRWGTNDSSISAASNPFNNTNSFEASSGHDITPRFEQAYMTVKLPYVDGAWYIGRLPGLDGAPQRAARSIFPRLFIDSEIDGTLLTWNAPETALDKVDLPWTSTRLWGNQCEPGTTVPVLRQYESKVHDKTGVVFGYLKYRENKMQSTDSLEGKGADSDAFLAQAQLKIGKDTEIIWDGLTMADWHMPNTSGVSGIPDVKTNYLLTGVYADTQLLGFQIYGAFYYSHFHTPAFAFTPAGETAATNVPEQAFPGHILLGGFNTGDLIRPDMQFTLEFADGSDAWINPFNYRGFRRKGTVLQGADNFFFDPSGSHAGNDIVGFYPFNAQVWDIYFDYFAWKNVRFRAGYLDFLYSNHDRKNVQNFAFLGSSKFQHDWWPYFEVNISF